MGHTLARTLGIEGTSQAEGILTPSLYQAHNGNLAGLHKEDYAANSVNFCHEGNGVKIWTAFHAEFTQTLMDYVLVLGEPDLKNQFQRQANTAREEDYYNLEMEHSHARHSTGQLKRLIV